MCQCSRCDSSPYHYEDGFSVAMQRHAPRAIASVAFNTSKLCLQQCGEAPFDLRHVSKTILRYSAVIISDPSVSETSLTTGPLEAPWFSSKKPLSKKAFSLSSSSVEAAGQPRSCSARAASGRRSPRQL
eukprot:s3540_g5.t1